MSEIDKFFGCVKKTLLFHFEKECITYLISKGLSIGIVLFSFTSKLPQILNMYKSKDIKGLSYLSIYLDVFSFLCSALYPFHKGYSFLTYGESVIILLENLFIFFMAWKYDINQSSDRQNMSFTLIICSFLFVVYKEFLDDFYDYINFDDNFAISFLPQFIYQNLITISQFVKNYNEDSLIENIYCTKALVYYSLIFSCQTNLIRNPHFRMEIFDIMIFI